MINFHKTVEELKEKILELTGNLYALSHIRLFFEHEQLYDDCTFFECEIESGDEISVVAGALGGMFHMSSGRNGFENLFKNQGFGRSNQFLLQCYFKHI
jgi:hypothetical protein